jgi:hypothetical protein
LSKKRNNDESLYVVNNLSVFSTDQRVETDREAKKNLIQIPPRKCTKLDPVSTPKKCTHPHISASIFDEVPLFTTHKKIKIYEI